MSEKATENNKNNVQRMGSKEHPSEMIRFAIYLTGHDRETIERMYEQWRKFNA